MKARYCKQCNEGVAEVSLHAKHRSLSFRSSPPPPQLVCGPSCALHTALPRLTRVRYLPSLTPPHRLTPRPRRRRWSLPPLTLSLPAWHGRRLCDGVSKGRGPAALRSTAPPSVSSLDSEITEHNTVNPLDLSGGRMKVRSLGLHEARVTGEKP